MEIKLQKKIEKKNFLKLCHVSLKYECQKNDGVIHFWSMLEFSHNINNWFA